MSKIGMRTIKTALSVFLCIVTLKLLNMHYPFYACIAAVISMQSSVSDSFITGKNRMIGTSVGALIGLVFALVHPENSILTGIGIIAVIYFCNLLNKKSSITIACIVFLAIMTNMKGQIPFIYSVTRLLETFIGIAIAVLVNYLISPPNYLNKMYSNCNTLIDDIFLFSRSLIKNTSNLNIIKLQKEIDNSENSLKTYLNEIKLQKTDNIKVDNIKKILNICSNAYIHLFTINSLKEDCKLNFDNASKYKKLFDEEINSNKGCLSTNLDLIFNYHVNKLLILLEELKKINIAF
ncbi:aromatic acid exporter family protein [Clostridium sp. KNHs214]|uniref:FUSC family protein n=1 Tax=Clostridium sp. KNHs214 TaxID=1540257 RepID=UPI0005501AD8|nr:aromatic acid exporter family protein [Clostridium sp. KNHs214]